MFAAVREMERSPELQITLPYIADDRMVDKIAGD